MAVSAAPSTLPRATTLPSLTPTSPAKPGLPEPSTIVPPVILRSYVIAAPWACSRTPVQYTSFGAAGGKYGQAQDRAHSGRRNRQRGSARGCARARSRSATFQLPTGIHRLRLVVRSPAADRQDDAGRRHGAAQGLREHLPRRRRLARRARPRFAVGPPDPDPP